MLKNTILYSPFQENAKNFLILTLKRIQEAKTKINDHSFSPNL